MSDPSPKPNPKLILGALTEILNDTTVLSKNTVWGNQIESKHLIAGFYTSFKDQCRPNQDPAFAPWDEWHEKQGKDSMAHTVFHEICKAAGFVENWSNIRARVGKSLHGKMKQEKYVGLKLVVQFIQRKLVMSRLGKTAYDHLPEQIRSSEPSLLMKVARITRPWLFKLVDNWDWSVDLDVQDFLTSYDTDFANSYLATCENADGVITGEPAPDAPAAVIQEEEKVGGEGEDCEGEDGESDTDSTGQEEILVLKPKRTKRKWLETKYAQIKEDFDNGLNAWNSMSLEIDEIKEELKTQIDRCKKETKEAEDLEADLKFMIKKVKKEKNTKEFLDNVVLSESVNTIHNTNDVKEIERFYGFCQDYFTFLGNQVDYVDPQKRLKALTSGNEVINPNEVWKMML